MEAEPGHGCAQAGGWAAEPRASEGAGACLGAGAESARVSLRGQVPGTQHVLLLD